MIRFVNAKINLGLNILRRRTDGYHDLETVFYPVGLYNGTPENLEPFCDILEITQDKNLSGDKYNFSGNSIDCPLEKNLVVKAVRLFRDEMEKKGYDMPSLSINLEKHIPDAAGLGGGSADASFTLMMLNELAGDIFNKEQLKTFALRLGADCPFFIENRPVLASGIGEVMKSIPVDLSGYWAVIIKPDINISTKEAFAGISPHLPRHRISNIITNPIGQWREMGLSNDFESHLFTNYPLLAQIKQDLYSSGALYDSMSGSGSSVYGIFPDYKSAQKGLDIQANATCQSNIRGFIIKL